MQARRALLLAFGFTTIYFTGFFPPTNNPNELSRLEAVVAFVESGTFSIDTTVARFGDQMDKSVWNGRFYSNKAPGLIFAAVPIYRLLRIFFSEPRWGWSDVFVLVRLATVSLAAVLALARFMRRLEEFPAGRGTAPLVAFAVVFGTPFLYYARSFFSHAWTASLLFLAWDFLRRSETRSRREENLLLGAGFLAGWAAISEYTAALIGIALAWRAAAGSAGRRGRAVSLFALGAAPALMLLAAYDAACFGSPWRLSSACEAFPAYAELARSPSFGLGLPSPRAAMATLFSPTRGVLLFSPFWLWAIGGWIGWWRSGRDRRDAVFTFAAAVLLWLSIAAYPNWEGGWSLGMRYLVPVLFLAALPIPYALQTALSRGLFLAAAVFSTAFHTLASFSYPHFPGSIAWPVANVSAFLVGKGAVAPNLGLLARLPPLLSLIPAFAVIAGGLALCLLNLPRSRPSRVLATALGLAVFGATLLAPPAISTPDRVWREGLAERLRGGVGP